MSEIVQSVKFPLDDEGFFRRECPLCCKEFKVLFKKEELADLSHINTESFILDSKEETEETDDNEKLKNEYFCPYCGQGSDENQWWTQEQVAYINVFLENIMSKLINDNLVGPMKKSFKKSGSGPLSFEFKANKLEQKEPWISPEINDMEVYDLHCCKRKIKIEDNWQNITYCFFCGFPYKYENKEED